MHRRLSTSVAGSTSWDLIRQARHIHFQARSVMRLPSFSRIPPLCQSVSEALLCCLFSQGLLATSLPTHRSFALLLPPSKGANTTHNAFDLAAPLVGRLSSTGPAPLIASSPPSSSSRTLLRPLPLSSDLYLSSSRVRRFVWCRARVPPTMFFLALMRLLPLWIFGYIAASSLVLWQVTCKYISLLLRCRY